MKRLARGVEISENSKLGSVSATYAAAGSCPTTCKLLKSGGCYGLAGPVSWAWKKLAGSDAELIARAEAREIAGLTGKRALRIHVLGDCRTRRAARIVAKAARRFTAWTYTHAWRNVQRNDWGNVSVLASCELHEDLPKAHARGYAPALVVAQHTSYKAHPLPGGFTGLPCPEQTGRTESCATCKLCWDADRLHRTKIVIEFAAHGTMKKKTLAALKGE